MEKADFLYAPFTIRSMVPEVGDELTVPWARRLAYNLINGYGLIGTLTLGANSEQIVNFDLTRKFQFPPHIYAYFAVFGVQFLQTSPEKNFNTPFQAYSSVFPSGYPAIKHFVNNDCVFFQNFSSLTCEVYFRIHGV
jgi:hypothetical protein